MHLHADFGELNGLSLRSYSQKSKPLKIFPLSIYTCKILVVCPSVRLSVCLLWKVGRMIWPCDTRGYISGHRALEATTRWALWAPVWALATGTNTSFLDGLYKPSNKWGLTFSGLQLGKQIDLWEDMVMVQVDIMEVVDSDFDFSHSQVLQGEPRAS